MGDWQSYGWKTALKKLPKLWEKNQCIGATSEIRLTWTSLEKVVARLSTEISTTEQFVR